MADRATGERKIAGKVTQNAPRCREISTTEYPIHTECGGAFKRTAHSIACCTYHFQVANAMKMKSIGAPAGNGHWPTVIDVGNLT